MTIMQIGVDLAKSVFEVAVSPAPGRVSEREQHSRTLPPFVTNRPSAEVLLEACGSARRISGALVGGSGG